MTTHQSYGTDDPPGGAAVAVVMGFLDGSGKWNPISPSNPFPGSSAAAQPLTLASNISVTGAQVGQTWGGGSGTFSIAGVLNGCVVNIEFQGANSQWIPAGSISATNTGIRIDGVPTGASVRANLIGGTPANVYATFQP